MRVRTRFAPSPTGDLHLGGAWTALASWLLARWANSPHVLRIEDLDTPRVVPGSAARITDDLAWLGLHHDEGPDRAQPHGPYEQSARSPLYAAAIDELRRKELVYLCDCSRKEIAAAASPVVTEASAPHGGELRYPGTCRDKAQHRTLKRDPSVRLRVPEESKVQFQDKLLGHQHEDVGHEVGDFVLQRGDGLYAYQLAVSVDDWAMEIDLVVRGADLLRSTARQRLLLSLLGAGQLPSYMHIPMVVAPDGSRLEKRTKAPTIRALRERGVSAELVLGHLAHGLGLQRTPSPISAASLAALPAATLFRLDPYVIPEALLMPGTQSGP